MQYPPTQGESAPVYDGSTSGSGGGDIISSAIALGGVLLNGYYSKRNIDLQNKANKDLANQEYQQNLSMWNQQNAYNSPLAQMQRYRQAGLNPNLIYGQGNNGNAGQMPQYHAPSVNMAFNPVQSIMEILGVYQDFRIKQAQINNMEAQGDNLRARTASEAYRGSLLDIQGKSADAKLAFDEYIRPYQSAIVGNAARGSEAKLREEWQKLRLLDQQELQRNVEMRYKEKAMSSMDIENEKKMSEILYNQYRNQWMKMGVTTSDSPLLRIFTRMLNESGLSPDLFMK